MELIEEFKEYTDIIMLIRKFLYANFLIDEYELCKFMAMYSNYQDASILNIEKIKSQWCNNIIFACHRFYDDNGWVTGVNHVNYNFKDWTIDYLGIGVYEKINFSTEISNFKLCLKSDKMNKKYLKTILENILLSDNDDIGIIFELVIGKKVYPLNLNAVLECAPYNLISKYYDRFFPNTHFKFNITTQNITINNTYNNIKCLIPRNLFETYCKFDALNKDFPTNSYEFTIPVAFNEISSEFFVECILAGKLLSLPNIMTENDFMEFKNLISYLDVNLFDDK